MPSVDPRRVELNDDRPVESHVLRVWNKNEVISNDGFKFTSCDDLHIGDAMIEERDDWSATTLTSIGVDWFKLPIPTLRRDCERVCAACDHQLLTVRARQRSHPGRPRRIPVKSHGIPIPQKTS